MLCLYFINMMFRKYEVYPNTLISLLKILYLLIYNNISYIALLYYQKKVHDIPPQQNKCYLQMCLLVHLEATLDLSSSEFTCS